MKSLIALAAVAISFNAYATASPQGCASSNGQAAGCTTTTVSPTITPTIAPVTTISPTMSPSASATGEGGQGGSANATGGNATGGNSNVNVTLQGGSSAAPSSIKTVGVAPDILSTPTAACRISVGASAGWLGGAFGFGTSALDEGCHIREVSRHLSNLGLREAAVLAMCQDSYARKAMGAICPPEEAAAETVKP